MITATMVHSSLSTTADLAPVCRWTRDGKRCQQRFSTHEQLFQHLVSTHIGRKIDGNLCLQCHWEDCQYQCSKRDHAISHCLTHIPGFRPYQCQSFARQPDLRKHIRTHDSKRLAAGEDGGNVRFPACGGEGRKRKTEQFQVINNLFGTIKQKKLKPEYNQEMAMQLDEIARFIMPSGGGGGGPATGATTTASNPPLRQTVLPVPLPPSADNVTQLATSGSKENTHRFHIQSWMHYSVPEPAPQLPSRITPSPTLPRQGGMETSADDYSVDMDDEEALMDLLEDYLKDTKGGDDSLHGIPMEVSGCGGGKLSVYRTEEDLREMNEFFTKLYAQVQNADGIGDWVNSSPSQNSSYPPTIAEEESSADPTPGSGIKPNETPVVQWIQQLKSSAIDKSSPLPLQSLGPARIPVSASQSIDKSVSLAALSESEVKEIVDNFFKDGAGEDENRAAIASVSVVGDRTAERAKNARVNILIKGLEELSLIKENHQKHRSCPEPGDLEQVKISRQKGGRYPVLPYELRNAIIETGAARKPLEPMNSDPISLIRVLQRKNRPPRPSILPPSFDGGSSSDGDSSGRVSPIFIQQLDQSLQVTRPDYRLENEFNPTTNPPTGRRLHRRTNYQQLNRSISQPITSSTIPRITKDARKRHMRVIEAVMNQLERIWEQMQSVSAS